MGEVKRGGLERGMKCGDRNGRVNAAGIEKGRRRASRQRRRVKEEACNQIYSRKKYSLTRLHGLTIVFLSYVA
jgi:hypothetical protein